MNMTFKQGFKDGIPIALGYFAVSFGFGVLALKNGLNIFESVFMSISNVTSAGQLAGLSIIAAGGTILEILLTQLIINLRYALMSLSLSQRIDGSLSIFKRMIIAFANTDEVFAVAMSHNRELTFKYMVGLEILPIFGWTLGTAMGACVSGLLPASLQSALSVALYGMFIAIVIPVAKDQKSVRIVALISLILSTALFYIPVLNKISSGIAIIICTVIAAGIGALLFPVKNESGDN